MVNFSTLSNTERMETLTGTIEQISISNGGVPKFAVPMARARRLGLEGDRQAHPQFHGGPRQALLLVSDEDLTALRQSGFPVFRGALGENLTVSGLNFRLLRAGMRFRAGEAIIELTKLRVPCEQLDPYNRGAGQIQEFLYDKQVKGGDVTSPRWGMGGMYASVIQEGIIKAGDIIRLLDQAV